MDRKTLILLIVTLIIGAVVSGCVGYRVPYDPEFSKLSIVSLSAVLRDGRTVWVVDSSNPPKPRMLSVWLGTKEVIASEKLNSDFQLGLVAFITPVLESKKLCDGGFDAARPHGGTKMGDLEFRVQCYWKGEKQ